MATVNDLEGLMQSVVTMRPEAVSMIERLESLLVGLVPIVARRSFGNVYALLGVDSRGGLTSPDRVEFILQDSGFFTVACFGGMNLDDSTAPRAMEVALALNAALPRGTFVVKGHSWFYRCELFFMGDDEELRRHLDQTIQNSVLSFGIFQLKLQEHLDACAADEMVCEDMRTDDCRCYQDPLLRSLMNTSDEE